MANRASGAPATTSPGVAPRAGHRHRSGLGNAALAPFAGGTGSRGEITPGQTAGKVSAGIGRMDQPPAPSAPPHVVTHSTSRGRRPRMGSGTRFSSAGTGSPTTNWGSLWRTRSCQISSP